jgi:hypothetical protein
MQTFIENEDGSKSMDPKDINNLYYLYSRFIETRGSFKLDNLKNFPIEFMYPLED